LQKGGERELDATASPEKWLLKLCLFIFHTCGLN